MEAVLANSGGVDSRVTAAVLHGLGWKLHSLFVDWNPPSSDSAGRAAAETARLYCVDHVTFRYLVDWRADYPRLGKRTTPYATPTTLMLSAQYAQHLGLEYIANGSRKGVVQDPRWLDRMRDVLNANTFAGGKVISVPLWDLDDAQVDRMGRELGVDMDSTWSCPEDPHCRTCASCKRRERMGLWLG